MQQLQLPTKEEIIKAIIKQLNDPDILPRKKLSLLPVLLKHDHSKGIELALEMRHDVELRDGVNVILLKYIDKGEEFTLDMINLEDGNEWSYSK